MADPKSRAQESTGRPAQPINPHVGSATGAATAGAADVVPLAFAVPSAPGTSGAIDVAVAARVLRRNRTSLRPGGRVLPPDGDTPLRVAKEP